jgi:Holliday junction resolvase-like predicted endonuclease
MVKYDPLRDFLAGRAEQQDHVTMDFSEIEGLVGPLPESAREHRAWWGNDSKVQAQAWRAAGWHVESVRQDSGRVVFARGKVGGTRLARQSASGSPVDAVVRGLQPPVTTAIPVEDGMPEATAQSLLVAHLVGQGWRIQRVADTATREQGIDVLAARGDRVLAVEVKGYPGKRYADPRRADQIKPTSPSVQARHWYAQAVLKAILTRNDHPHYVVAIALPDAPTYRSLHQRTLGSLQLLDITTFLIAGNGQVQEV